LLPASTTGDQHRETVTAAAKLVEYGLAVVPFVSAVRRRAGGEMNDLWNLRHAFVDTGQRIGLVVHDDKNLQLIQVFNTVGK
jgi:hypothetical protein